MNIFETNKNFVISALLPVIRGKDFVSLGLSQTSRMCCGKKKLFKDDNAIRNAPMSKLKKEIKKHKLGSSSGTKDVLISKLIDHYNLYHS